MMAPPSGVHVRSRRLPRARRPPAPPESVTVSRSLLVLVGLLCVFSLALLVAMEAPFQLAHTGTGGMTSSLSVGTAGSAAVRKLRQFPLSPLLITGRSDIKVAKLEDPRFFNVQMPDSQLAASLQVMAAQQWPSRSRPVHDRATIEAALKQME